ncbi:hypothetical protein BRD16_00750 [Halobacteriales archaeon SW_6_65_46]|nr:MAG: hypothetical protein BRD16_00750 [Halobacteriales archaeon SW_6_65_46]
MSKDTSQAEHNEWQHRFNSIPDVNHVTDPDNGKDQNRISNEEILSGRDHRHEIDDVLREQREEE